MTNPPKRPVRFFNTTGPCNPWDHYMLPPEERLVGAQLHRYIGDNLYWVLHAPRQTGKTTFLQSWMREINAGNEAIASYVSVERCKGVSDPQTAMPALCDAVKESAMVSGLLIPASTTSTSPFSALSNILHDWAALVAPKPLVILFDEVDVLQDETMISFLQQLRGGFMNRAVGIFPTSIALVGIRDLKDYLVAAKGGVPLNVGSAFNIKADSVLLSNFSIDEIKKLFSLRTGEIGQEISDEALEYVWEQSRGQPWIVNSLFMRATMRVLDAECYDTVTLDHVRKAREQMVFARETHLDSLAFRMKDPGIRGVLESLMTGASNPTLVESDGFSLCLDLGLVAIEKSIPQVANPIYREVLARHITYGSQLAIPEPEWQWEKIDGSLDMDRLLKEFQIFWRENSEIWEEKSDYTEAFPHLLLQAFLQRVLNGGGNIEREYAAGRGRMDLFVEYKSSKYIIEVKLIHPRQSLETIKAVGLRQTAKYRDTRGPKAPAYLVIFDRRPEAKQKSWDDRLLWDIENGITVVQC